MANTGNSGAAAGIGGVGGQAATGSGLPAGATRVGGNSQNDVYRDASGNLYVVSKTTGAVLSTEAPGQGAPGIYGQASNIARGATDAVGLTQPAPPDIRKTPEFARLGAAADMFQGDYGQAKDEASQTRGIDLDTIAELQAAAAGKRPSAAEALMRKASDENARRSLGMAATLSGSNPGMALREGLDAFQDTGAKSAADLAALRAKEQESARVMLAQQTAEAANRDTQNKLSTGNTYAGSVAAPYQAMRDFQALDNQRRAGNQAFAGSVLGSAGTVLAASDPALKTGAAPAPGAADAFLDSLNPSTFQYKTPGPNMPPGQRLGVMADELPKHDVATGPDGKKWISASVISDILAGLGRVNDKVEGRAPVAGTVAGGSPEYAAAMDYMIAPRVDAGTMARAAAGRAPLPRSMTGPDDEMVPMSAVRAMLAQAGR